MAVTFDPNSPNTSVFSILGEDYPTIAQGDRPAGVITYVYGTARLAFLPNDIARYNFPAGVHILGQAGLGAHRGTTWDLQVACDQGRLKIYGIEPGTVITDGAYYDSCWYRAKDASGKFVDNCILGAFIDDSAAQWNREHQEAGGTPVTATATSDMLRSLSVIGTGVGDIKSILAPASSDALTPRDVLSTLYAINTGMMDLKAQVQSLQQSTSTPSASLINPKTQAKLIQIADDTIKSLADAGLDISGGGHWVVALRNLVHTIKGA